MNWILKRVSGAAAAKIEEKLTTKNDFAFNSKQKLRYEGDNNGVLIASRTAQLEAGGSSYQLHVKTTCSYPTSANRTAVRHCSFNRIELRDASDSKAKDVLEIYDFNSPPVTGIGSLARPNAHYLRSDQFIPGQIYIADVDGRKGKELIVRLAGGALGVYVHEEVPPPADTGNSGCWRK